MEGQFRVRKKKRSFRCGCDDMFKGGEETHHESVVLYRKLEGVKDREEEKRAPRQSCDDDIDDPKDGPEQSLFRRCVRQTRQQLPSMIKRREASKNSPSTITLFVRNNRSCQTLRMRKTAVRMLPTRKTVLCSAPTSERKGRPPRYQM